MSDRNSKILSRLNRQDKIIELGPSYSPVLTREHGWNVYNLDHLSADALRDKYRNEQNVDISRIQDVDFIWNGGPLHTALPEEHLGTFDGVIASHMIEHAPDLVSFFDSAARMLKPDGILSLVVPDKRFCFDYFQPLSMTGDVLNASHVKRTRHSRVSAFNAAAYMVKNGEAISWGQRPTDILAFREDGLGRAYQSFLDHLDDPSAEYADVHGWYFTANSFRLICLELRMLGLIGFEEADFFATSDCEFFCSLRQADEGFKSNGQGDSKRRLELLKSVLFDIREQTDFLIEGKNYIGR